MRSCFCEGNYKNPVFTIAALVILLLVILGALFPVRFGEVASNIFDMTTRNFSWFYLLAVLSLFSSYYS